MQDIMQDRYKFKIWDKTEKKFLPLDSKTENTDSWISIDNTGVYLVERDNARDVAFFTDITEDVIILQCTGRCDDKKQLIYEGDIVNGHCGVYWMKMLVIWDEISAAFYFKKLDKKGKLLPFVSDPTFVEIIGNRYENPELLEVGILA